MSTVWRDVVYGLRMLVRKPGFTAAAVLSLALGIGANTTVFSIINGTLLGALPFEDTSRLMILWNVPVSSPQQRNSVTVTQYRG